METIEHTLDMRSQRFANLTPLVLSFCRPRGSGLVNNPIRKVRLGFLAG